MADGIWGDSSVPVTCLDGKTASLITTVCGFVRYVELYVGLICVTVFII